MSLQSIYISFTIYEKDVASLYVHFESGPKVDQKNKPHCKCLQGCKGYKVNTGKSFTLQSVIEKPSVKGFSQLQGNPFPWTCRLQGKKGIPSLWT